MPAWYGLPALPYFPAPWNVHIPGIRSAPRLFPVAPPFPYLHPGQALRFPDALPCPHLHPIRMFRFLDALPCPHLHQIRMPRFLAAPPCPRLHPGRMPRFLDAPPCPYLHPYRARLFPDALRRLYTKRQPAFPCPVMSCSRAPGVPGGYLPFPYLIPYPLYDLPSSDVHLSYDSF